MEISDDLQALAHKYGVTVERDNCNLHPNEGAVAGNNIWLSSFDDHQLELAAFFHELGHVRAPTITKRGMYGVVSKFSAEALAWELGLGIAWDEGYRWDSDSHVLQYARAKLATYATAENMK